MSQDEPKVVHPSLTELLPTPAARERFEGTAAAIEAADLVRTLRRQAMSADGTRGISQIELATRTGLSQPRISQIEKGEGRDGLTYALLRKVAYACGVNWREMMLRAIEAAEQDRPDHRVRQPQEKADDAPTATNHPSGSRVATVRVASLPRTARTNAAAGMEIYDTAGEKLGSIDSVVIDPITGNIRFAVIGSGGFLGVGEHYYPVPWKRLEFDPNTGGYIADTDKSTLQHDADEIMTQPEQISDLESKA